MPELSASAESTVVESNPSLDSAVDAIIASPAADPAPETSVEEAAPAEVTPVPAEPATGEEEATPEVVEQVEVDPEDDSDLDKALEPGQKVNPLDLASSRGQKIYRSYKAYKALQDAVGEDLTPEVVTGYKNAQVDKELMEFEFGSGDPARARNFAEFWNTTSPQGMMKLAEVLPEVLVQHNPAAAVALAVPILGRYTGALYDRAQQETDPAKKAALLYTARMIDWDLNGSYRPDTQLANPQQQIDPRIQQVEQRWNEIQRFQNAQMEQSRNAWVTALDEANSSILDAESDKVLAPLKAAYPSEKIYQSIRREFIEAVIAQVAKDQSGEQLYQVNRTKAMSRMSSADIEALSRQYGQRASRVIKAMAPQFLKEAGVSAVKQSQERNQALAKSAAAGSAPQTGGAPNPKTVIPLNGKKFASRSEQFDAEIDNLLKS